MAKESVKDAAKRVREEAEKKFPDEKL